MAKIQGFDIPPPYSEQFPPEPGYDQTAAQGYAPQPWNNQPAAQRYVSKPGYAPRVGYNSRRYPRPQGYPPAQGYPAPQQHGNPPPQPGYPGQPPYSTQSQFTTVVVANQPSMGPVVVAAGPYPPDYLIHSILACIFCFFPTGLFAIFYASRRNTLMAQGYNIEANRMATNARNLTILSVILGICWIVVVIVVLVVVASSASNDQYRD